MFFSGGKQLKKSLRSLGWGLLAITMAGRDLAVMANDEEAKANSDAGQKGPIIGIDLGTTYSCVAVSKGDQIEIVPNDQGGRTTPSWVAYTSGGLLVGEGAKNQVALNPLNTIFDAKRILGRAYSDPTIIQDIKSWPFKVIEEGGKPKIKVTYDGVERTKAPEEISAQVLKYLKDCAEAYLGQKVTRAVITVPAYFNDAQRQATKDAGAIAGLTVERILNEPTAAALAYGIDKQGASEKKILVYDLGGGTFDVSLLAFGDGVFEVKSVSGDTHLGGQDFDLRIVQHLLKDIKERHGVDLTSNKKAFSKLRAEAEKAKRHLSSATQTKITLDNFLPSEARGGPDYEFSLTRALFEELNKDLFQKTLPPIDTALKSADWTRKDVDIVLLVGGSTRIPKVKQMLTEIFGAKVSTGVDADEAVAKGAAIQADIIDNKGKSSSLLVLDVTPLSLGIETLNGVMSVVIPRNTMIPTKKAMMYSTAANNQEAVTVRVFEGERPLAKDNHYLGEFHLSGIPLAPRGVPQIEVTIDVDANSIVTVSAVEKATGKSGKINITEDKHKLSKDEINKMIEDAEKFRAQDEVIKAKVEARNGLDNYLYHIKAQVDDDKIGSKISADDKAKVVALVEEKIKWMETNKDTASKEDFEEQKHEVEKVFGPIISKLYQEMGAGGAEDAGASSAKADHDEL